MSRLATIPPAELGGMSIYFTEADPSGVVSGARQHEDLLLKLKAWLLLADRIVIAGTHVLDSPEVGEMLRTNHRLLDDGVVVPYLRSGISSFADYVELKADEGDSAFLDPTRRAGQLARARLLDEHTPAAVLWEPEPAIALYRSSLLQELTNRHSAVRRKLVGVSNRDIVEAARKIEDATTISRETVARIATEHLGRKRGVLNRHSDYVYYLWGATHLGCEPALHPAVYTLGETTLRALTERLALQFGERPPATDRANGVEGLQHVLDRCGFSRSTLDRLDLGTILDLRRDSLAVRFRRQWDSIVKAARAVDAGSDANRAAAAAADLRQLLDEQLATERMRLRRRERVRRGVSVASFVTSGVAVPFSGLEVGLATWLLSLAALDPLVEAIARRIPGTEISMFASRIHAATP